MEDESHAECIAREIASLEEAGAELRRLLGLRWDEEPNLAPCTTWSKCGRRYEVVGYDTSEGAYREVRRIPALDIRASGVTWHLAGLA
jgi:hypothetical protein